MDIYFSCSITGGRRDQAVYAKMVDFMTEKGYHVQTAHLSRPDVLREEKAVDAVDVYQRDVDWVETCGALVAEVSTPSHGVGYEIALALLRGKAVLCCYRKGCTISKMILGNTHPNMSVYAYQGFDDLASALVDFLARAAPGR